MDVKNAIFIQIIHFIIASVNLHHYTVVTVGHSLYIKYNIYSTQWRKDTMSVAEKIRIIANRRNMTLKQVAAALGEAPQNFSNKMSRDNFSESDLKRIADALDCEYAVTFTMDDSGDKI